MLICILILGHIFIANYFVECTEISKGQLQEKNESDLADIDYTMENIVLLVHKSLDNKLNHIIEQIEESTCSSKPAKNGVTNRRECDLKPAKIEAKSELGTMGAAEENYFYDNILWPHKSIPEDCFEAYNRRNFVDANVKNNTKMTNPILSVINPKIFHQPFVVQCEIDSYNGAWTIIQRRQDGAENFQRNWLDYVNGFGDISAEFFIGLEKLYALTNSDAAQELYILLEDFDGVIKYARYDHFQIGPSNTSYTLQISGYSGDAGDDMLYHNGQKFTTIDRDNDNYMQNCAIQYKGGWWYNACHTSNLNGLYLKGIYSNNQWAQGINWHSFHGWLYSLKFVQMMIRPKRKFK